MGDILNKLKTLKKGLGKAFSLAMPDSLYRAIKDSSKKKWKKK